MTPDAPKKIGWYYPRDIDARPLTKSQQKLVLQFMEDYKSPIQLFSTKFKELWFAALYLRIDKDDIEQASYLGVVKAARRFTPGVVGYEGQCMKFSSYAAWWIRNEVSRIVAHVSRHARVPNMDRDVVSIFAVSWKNEGEVDHPPVFDSDDHYDDPDTWELVEVRKTLASLSDRDRRIVEARFGLGDYGRVCHTLVEIGEEFGVSKERVRQILLSFAVRAKAAVQKLEENRV